MNGCVADSLGPTGTGRFLAGTRDRWNAIAETAMRETFLLSGSHESDREQLT